MLVAETTTGCYFGGTALGNPKLASAKTGAQAAAELLKGLASGGCVDEWLQDQLIIFMALAHGTSEMITGPLSLHTKTAISHATEICGASFDVEQLPDVASSASASASPGVDAGAGADEEAAPIYGQVGKDPGRFMIRCRGIGFVNKQVL